MLVSSFNLLKSFNYTPYLFYKKRFKSEINSFCIWTLHNKIGTLYCYCTVCGPGLGQIGQGRYFQVMHRARDALSFRRNIPDFLFGDT